MLKSKEKKDRTAIMDMKNMEIKAYPDTEDLKNVPQLQYGLNKLLDGKLVMGDMGLGPIPQLTQTQIDSISQYVNPSKDTSLQDRTFAEGCTFFSSTSGISSVLSQIYYHYSNRLTPNFENVMDQLETPLSKNYLVSYRKPVSFVLRRHPKNTYSVSEGMNYLEDNFSSNQVLLNVGNIGQFFLVSKPENVEKLKLNLPFQQTPRYYRYSRINKELMLRSQIDCCHYPEGGDPYVFEIKTRACAPIRYDVLNWEDYLDYPIKQKRGNLQSFEREYFDLIRGAFLKYGFQLKIGNMDGAFIAYHNTQRIYGFEYVKLREIVYRIFGNNYNFNLAFMVCSRILTTILKDILQQFPLKEGEQLLLGMYDSYYSHDLIVFVEVLDCTRTYPVRNNETVLAYFDKHFPSLPNPVYRIQYKLKSNINGVFSYLPGNFLSPNDYLNIFCQLHSTRRVTRAEYIEFLRDADKEPHLFGQGQYDGSWGN